MKNWQLCFAFQFMNKILLYIFLIAYDFFLQATLLFNPRFLYLLQNYMFPPFCKFYFCTATFSLQKWDESLFLELIAHNLLSLTIISLRNLLMVWNPLAVLFIYKWGWLYFLLHNPCGIYVFFWNIYHGVKFYLIFSPTGKTESFTVSMIVYEDYF